MRADREPVAECGLGIDVVAGLIELAMSPTGFCDRSAVGVF
jgi:hypothetical protein